MQSPLLPDAGFAILASGGHYFGATYMPASGLHVRLGATQWNDRSDRLALESAITGLPLAYDRGASQSLLAGVSWEASRWADFGVTAIRNVQQGFGAISNLAQDKVDTQALDMAAHLKLGNGWVTTASYSQGLSQLDQRAQVSTLDTRSYSIAIAKHGLFGDDALGFSFSRPALGLIDKASARFPLPAICRRCSSPMTGSPTRPRKPICSWAMSPTSSTARWRCRPTPPIR